MFHKFTHINIYLSSEKNFLNKNKCFEFSFFLQRNDVTSLIEFQVPGINNNNNSSATFPISFFDCLFTIDQSKKWGLLFWSDHMLGN